MGALISDVINGGDLFLFNKWEQKSKCNNSGGEHDFNILTYKVFCVPH